jgi:hypothetical protein
MKSSSNINEFSTVIRSMKPILLLSLLVVGALGGFAVRHYFLAKYEARISLPLSGDLAIFREAQPSLSSPSAFAKYGAKHNISDNADFHKIYQQFARNLSSPIKIEHAFRISRKDLRDLPDLYAKDELGRQVAVGGLQSDVQVYATDKEPETAIRLAKLAMGYLRDSLAAVSLKSTLHQWGPVARTELAMKRESIAKFQADLESTSRQIASMERLRERFKDEKDFAVSSSGSPPVQVQVTGTRNLWPVLQLIGMETDRANFVESLRLAEQDRVRLETLVRFFDLFDSRAGDGASIDLAKEIFRRANQPGASHVGNEADPTERALATIGVQMQSILARFDETKTDPIEPETRSVGIGRSLAVLFGLVAAAAAWLLLVLIFSFPRSKPDGII